MGNLFCDDCLNVLPTLEKESIDLIYIDPPFCSQRDYGQFDDRWESLQSYLNYMRIRVELMYQTLKPTGSFYYHCDPTASHYIKMMLDCIFGMENFRNEIIWSYTGNQKPKNRFPEKHDTIFFYVKSNGATFNFIYEAFSPATIKRYNHSDENGRYKMNMYNGKMTKAYMPTEGKRTPDVWPISWVIPTSNEALGYPTQKPLLLLERIIKASSNPGDVVADFFCGCGTAIEASEKLGREWIGVDINPKAIEKVKERIFNAV